MNNKLVDAAGDPISERAIQFILSLAPPVEIVIKESEMLFVDDKLDHDYFLAREKQLRRSMTSSIDSNQYNLYNELYKQANFALDNCRKINISEQAQRAIDTKIDFLLAYINREQVIIDCFEGYYFNPLNKTQMNYLMSFEGLKENPYDNLYADRHENVIQAICSVLDLADKTPYIIPGGFLIKSMPVPIWEPNIALMQSDAFSLGHFTGPCGQLFYTPECKKSISAAPTGLARTEARSQLSTAKKSLLPAYKVIVDNKLTPIRISTHTSSVIYLEPK